MITNIQLNKKNLQTMQRISRLIKNEFNHHLRLSDPNFFSEATDFSIHSGYKTIELLIDSLFVENRSVKSEASNPLQNKDSKLQQSKSLKKMYRGREVISDNSHQVQKTQSTLPMDNREFSEEPPGKQIESKYDKNKNKEEEQKKSKEEKEERAKPKPVRIYRGQTVSS